MECLYIFIVHVMSTCTATKILYVLPDNVSDVNCPSQPCATLGQYLMENNGSLPFLSDVEYHFLPGEHHVVDVFLMIEVNNFSLIGFNLSPTKLVCWSHSYVGVYYSYNVTVRNLVFSQCNSDIFFQYGIDVAAGLVLYKCSQCIAEDIYCYGYGFVGFNLLINCYLNNITIDMSTVKPDAYICSPKFSLIYTDTEHDCDHDYVLINEVFISGYTEICYGYHKAMEINLYQNQYDMNVELSNSQFYNMDLVVLHIQMSHANNSLLIKNCTFKHIKGYLDQLVDGKFSVNNVTVLFENCLFYYNEASILLNMKIASFDDLCLNPPNFTFKNCDFNDNNGTLLWLSNHAPNCKTSIYFKEIINVAENKADLLMYFFHTSVYMNGVITVLENILELNIINIDNCDITFTKTVKFLLNTLFI